MKYLFLVLCGLLLSYTQLESSSLEAAARPEQSNHYSDADGSRSKRAKPPAALNYLQASRAIARGALTAKQKSDLYDKARQALQTKASATGKRLGELYLVSTEKKLTEKETSEAKALVIFGTRLPKEERKLFNAPLEAPNEETKTAISLVSYTKCKHSTLPKNISSTYPDAQKFAIHTYWGASLTCDNTAQLPSQLTRLEIYAQGEGTVAITIELPETLKCLALSCKTGSSITLTEPLPKGVVLRIDDDKTGKIAYPHNTV